MDKSEKKVQERVKSTEKRSSRSFKSFASTVAATERMKRTSGSGRHKQESGQEREGRSHSKDNRGTAQHQGKDCETHFMGKCLRLFAGVLVVLKDNQAGHFW